jgi:chromosome transmission fidelity protein 4
MLAIALSYSHVVACTSKGYVRVYTTQGTPVRLYRQKYMPVVTCASWKNYVMVVGNGGALGDGPAPNNPLEGRLMLQAPLNWCIPLKTF